MIFNAEKFRFTKSKRYQFPSILKLVSYFNERVEIDSIISNLDYSNEVSEKGGKIKYINLTKKKDRKYLLSLKDEVLKKTMPVFFVSKKDQDLLEFLISLDKICPVSIFVSKDNLKNTFNLDQKLNGFKGTFYKGSENQKEKHFIYIGGSLTNIKEFKGSNKKICAIVSAYEDEDIIEYVCNYLLEEDLYVHVIDNWSKDNTYSIVKNLSKLNSKITLERFPDKPSPEYIWEEILNRKEDFAAETKFDWYIHYDSDEIRESCWENSKLKESIGFVDALGYTAIDHTVLDFRPVDDNFVKGKSLRKSFNFFEFGQRPGHFEQIKAWKNLGPVDLVSSGGHRADFQGRKIFPFKFLLRHYPLRNLDQMEKKIFKDRLPRIGKEKKERGWHMQYDSFAKEREKIKLWKKSDLLEYEPSFLGKYLIERLTGINIREEID